MPTRQSLYTHAQNVFNHAVPDEKISICFVGDENVGKSSLIQYMDQGVISRSKSNKKIDFKQKKMQIDGLVVRVVMWDTFNDN